MMKLFALMAIVPFAVISCSDVNMQGNDDNSAGKIVKQFDPERLPEGAVDMGVSVAWATCNLGADDPTQVGYRYKWGELGSCRNDSEELYDFYVGEGEEYSKYNSTDKKTVLDPEDDAATFELGTGWRIPTSDEWKELVVNCTSESWEEDNVHGVKLTSKINGQMLFFKFSDKNCFWGSTLRRVSIDGYKYASHCGVFEVASILECNPYAVPRYFSLYIRPVYSQ